MAVFKRATDRKFDGIVIFDIMALAFVSKPNTFVIHSLKFGQKPLFLVLCYSACRLAKELY